MSIDHMASGATPGDALSDFIDYGRQTKAKPDWARRRRFRVSLLMACCMLVGVILARGGNQSLVAPPAANSFSQAGFVANERLAPMVSFSPPETLRAQTHYQARIRENPEERWDTLTFGDAGADEILFRVTLHSAKSAPARSSLFVELAKQSAEIGAAVVHATNPQLYATGRGSVEWAEITLSGPKGERSCLGFRFVRTRDTDLSGFACGARAAPLDRVALGRLIDRLSTTSSGMEAGLGEVLKSGAT